MDIHPPGSRRSAAGCGVRPIDKDGPRFARGGAVSLPVFLGLAQHWTRARGVLLPILDLFQRGQRVTMYPVLPSSPSASTGQKLFTERSPEEEVSTGSSSTTTPW